MGFEGLGRAGPALSESPFCRAAANAVPSSQAVAASANADTNAARASSQPCATLAPAVATSTATAPPFLDVLAYEYGLCVQPAYHQADLQIYDGPGSYRFKVRDEAYTLALQERMGFSVQAGIDGPVVAVVKLERPPAAQFQEQALWRERSLRDVADRSGVALEARVLADGARLLIVNKSPIAGADVGQSLLIHPRRQLFVGMAWPNRLPGYQGPDGMALVRKVQDDVWQRMQSCPPAA